MSISEQILPSYVDNQYKGNKIAFYFFYFITLVITLRSLIHLLAPDGGAGSVAGINLSVAGAESIVFAFALWGSAQLLYSIIQLVVAFRYRRLIPFMYLLLLVEIILRMFIGVMRPVDFTHTPPGAVGTFVLLPIIVLMLYLSLQEP